MITVTANHFFSPLSSFFGKYFPSPPLLYKWRTKAT
jgi:hypothetical protein